MSMIVPKVFLAGGLSLLLWAVPPQAAAQASLPPASGGVHASAPVLPFEQLERRAASEVPYITELEVHDLLLKVKGHDAQGLKVELLMDRRDGQVLARKVKYPKHMRGYAAPGAPAPGLVPRVVR